VRKGATDGRVTTGQFDERGIVYGPAFRTIPQSVGVAENQALAEIHLPDSVLLEARTIYRVHPALLDAACRRLARHSPKPEKTSLIFRWGSTRWLSIGQPAWRHLGACANPTRKVFNEPTLRADLVVFGANGERLVDIQGLILGAREPFGIRKINPQQLRRWLYEVEWKAQPLARATAGLRFPVRTAGNREATRHHIRRGAGALQSGRPLSGVRAHQDACTGLYRPCIAGQLGFDGTNSERVSRPDELIDRFCDRAQAAPDSFCACSAIMEEDGVIAGMDGALGCQIGAGPHRPRH